MIDKDEIVNYEDNKDDPNWSEVFRELQDSAGVFKIGKLIVHPGAKIDVLVFPPSEKLDKPIVDLDVLELVSGTLFITYRDRFNPAPVVFFPFLLKNPHVPECPAKQYWYH